LEGNIEISSATYRAVSAVRQAITIKAQLVAEQCLRLLYETFPGVDVLERLCSTVCQLQMQARSRVSIADRLAHERCIQAHTELLAVLESSSRSHSTEADLATAEQQVAEMFGSQRLLIQIGSENQKKYQQWLRESFESTKEERDECDRQLKKRQMRDQCTAKILGCLVQVFNLAYAVGGLYLIAAAIWSMSKLRTLDLLPPFTYKMPIGGIVIGSSALVLSLVICCAARPKSPWLSLCTFLLFFFTMGVHEVALITLVALDSGELFAEVQNNWVALGTNGTQTKIDVETGFKCCGWSANTTLADTEAIAMVAECASIPPNWTVSCNSTINHFITSQVDFNIISAFALFTLQLFSMVFLISWFAVVANGKVATVPSASATSPNMDRDDNSSLLGTSEDLL
ncbi:MAG: tetraspanin family protein, partial [Phycisphaerales bacterium]|nr:tetraspanin family protein [Phycisphaerales bacterium]